MTLWWLLPLFALNVAIHPLFLNLSSHFLYLVLIVIAGLASLAFSATCESAELWTESTPWGQYHVLCAGYTIQMIVSTGVVLYLGSIQAVEYYGAGVERSVALVFIPSVMVYFIAGVVARWISQASRRKKKPEAPKD